MQGSTLFWLLALGATAAFLMLRAQNQFRRIAQSQGPAPREARRSPQRAALPSQKPLEAQRWEVEMQETMRSWSAQLDSKLGALQHFIRLAEDASARLEAAVADARYLDGVSPQRAPFAPAEPAARAASQADGLRASFRQAAADAPPPSPGIPGEGRGEGRATDLSATAQPNAGERPFSRIHSLADAGYDAAAIAEQVGSPIGEVELILSLRRQAAG